MDKTSLQDALAAAEAELSTLAEQSREAYRRYHDLDVKVNAKAAEAKELRRQLREAGDEPAKEAGQ